MHALEPISETLMITIALALHLLATLIWVVECSSPLWSCASSGRELILHRVPGRVFQRFSMGVDGGDHPPVIGILDDFLGVGWICGVAASCSYGKLWPYNDPDLSSYLVRTI